MTSLIEVWMAAVLVIAAILAFVALAIRVAAGRTPDDDIDPDGADAIQRMLDEDE